MINDWAHSYRTVANAMKQTADTSGGEAFNPYSKGGESGAKFSALTGTANYTGNVLGTYANSMKQYQEEQGRAAAAEQSRKNKLEQSNALDDLSQQADLMGKADDLKQQMFTPLFGEGFDKNEVQQAINYSIKIDNTIQNGTSLDDIQGFITEGSKSTGLDPLVSQYLSQYAMKAYNLYGNTYQSATLPPEPAPAPEPSLWDKIKKWVG